MKNPYEVLGIDKKATDEQVKEAYRALAKKYHPDHYVDNELADLAAEKMKEINEAYDTIINSRRKHGKQGSYPGNGEFADIRSMIAAGRLDDAQELLDGVPVEMRSAEWYFLNGTVSYRRGWYDAAYTSFATACRMDSSNPEYRAAFARIQHQRSGFGGYRGASNPNYRGGCDGCDVCSSLICADCCCECMGGDLIRCC
ncbi:MAG: J domain-containing protein [Clostridia bacterium]|nr:J domain-containing protein [Clostridia bacterium]